MFGPSLKGEGVRRGDGEVSELRMNKRDAFKLQ